MQFFLKKKIDESTLVANYTMCIDVRLNSEKRLSTENILFPKAFYMIYFQSTSLGIGSICK